MRQLNWFLLKRKKIYEKRNKESNTFMGKWREEMEFILIIAFFVGCIR